MRVRGMVGHSMTRDLQNLVSRLRPEHRPSLPLKLICQRPHQERSSSIKGRNLEAPDRGPPRGRAEEGRQGSSDSSSSKKVSTARARLLRLPPAKPSASSSGASSSCRRLSACRRGSHPPPPPHRPNQKGRRSHEGSTTSRCQQCAPPKSRPNLLGEPPARQWLSPS